MCILRPGMLSKSYNPNAFPRDPMYACFSPRHGHGQVTSSLVHLFQQNCCQEQLDIGSTHNLISGLCTLHLPELSECHGQSETLDPRPGKLHKRRRSLEWPEYAECWARLIPELQYAHVCKTSLPPIWWQVRWQTSEEALLKKACTDSRPVQ